ncbi:phosphatidylinositol kinase [Saccharomonospora piscinae]|uniref:Phosphatidylinositol kinase n=1 Tax=Saccharomonospora piscinae TaxID=687388 RepID=A0A1V9ACD4_SACPI|nr:SCO1664 family protein [Saccharomonospora piscinae]OQO94750.1 phosphatidylinositol kinase [Saccharomonospora piscinae]
MTEHVEATDPAALEVVTRGALDVEGRLVDASNVTLLCSVELDGAAARAVYKPVAGERPLWDFPDGTLAGRETATYLISREAGLGHVPPTVLRDGPLGEGMVQLWIDTTDEPLVDVLPPAEVPAGWKVVLRAATEDGEPVVLAHTDHPGVRELAALDIVVNNTDRKGGHVLPGRDGLVYGVDHGICLHTEPKLRTVLWGWAGQALPGEVLDKLRKLRFALDHDLGDTLALHLTPAEITAVAERTDALLAAGTLPAPGDDWRPLPWPLF